jgi:hypothetical protein
LLYGSHMAYGSLNAYHLLPLGFIEIKYHTLLQSARLARRIVFLMYQKPS